MTASEDLARRVRDVSRLTGEFVLRSGRIANEYVLSGTALGNHEIVAPAAVTRHLTGITERLSKSLESCQRHGIVAAARGVEHEARIAVKINPKTVPGDRVRAAARVVMRGQRIAHDSCHGARY